MKFPCYTPKPTKNPIAFALDPSYKKFKKLSLPQISTVCSTSRSSLQGYLEIFQSWLADQSKCSRAKGFGTRAGVSLIISLPYTNPVYIGKTRNTTVSPSPFLQPHVEAVGTPAQSVCLLPPLLIVNAGNLILNVTTEKTDTSWNPVCSVPAPL